MPCKRIKIGAKGYVSASQVANMYGCGYGTMLDLYNRYKGVASDTEVSEEAQKSMEFGSFFEDSVAKFVAKKLGLGPLIKCGTMAYFTADRPRLICHPDRLVKNPKDGKRIALEIKCVSPYAEGWGEEGTEEIPDVYYFQVQTYYATEVPCDVVYVCCLRGNRVYVYMILPNAEIIADIKKRADKCIADFEEGIVPSSENYKEQLIVSRKNMDWQAEAIGANDDILARVTQLKKIKENIAILEEKEESYKKAILEYMGTSPTLVTVENGKMKKLATFAEREKKSFDYKTFVADHKDMDFKDYWKVTKYVDFRVSTK